MLTHLFLKKLAPKKILILIFVCISFFSKSQSNKGKSGVEVLKAYTQEVVGYNVGYYVEFINKSNLVVDALEWNAYYYNNFGDFKGKLNASWSSGNFIKSIAPGEKTIVLKPNWLKGANKVFISITRVHQVK